MYKKRYLIPIASISFVILLALIFLLDTGTQGTTSAEIRSEPTSLGPLSEAFISVSRDVKPSVVNISTTSVVKRPRSGAQRRRDPSWPFRDFFGESPFRRFFNEPQSQTRRSLGSGVIVDEEGYILTNNHVVSGADKIKVALSDEREFDAKLIGTDKDTDIAVIRIDAGDLPVARMGDSDDLQVGQWVLAIGNPFRLSNTVTHGIISATGRSNVNLATYEDFIQTDASINPGNSGGPLVNTDGEVVGINTAIATAGGVPGNVGVGFAIPINMARQVMGQLTEKGRVVRGWLGIQLQDVSSDIAEKYGLEEPRGVLIVLAGGPAKQAGLKPGDLITQFNGEPVQDGAHLKKLVAASRPGESIEIRTIRDGKEEEFKVKLSERTDEVLVDLGGEPVIPSRDDSEEWMGVAR